MPREGFEPMIPVFEQAKSTLFALSATVIGLDKNRYNPDKSSQAVTALISRSLVTVF
jgi:hypothetical protein